jgi:hypothetical protein
MAIGKTGDSGWTIYNEQFYGGWSEVIQQNIDAFNTSSAGAITLSSRAIKGHYEQQTFIKTISSLISRRDITSVSAATDLALPMAEIATVKLNRKIGPVAHTIDSLRKLGRDDQEISFVLGQQVGSAIAQEMLNTALSGTTQALLNVAANLYDGTASTLTHAALTQGLQKFGDQSNRIVCFVMHSKQYFDLVRQALTDKIVEVAGATIYSGSVATFNRPVLVTDSASIWLDTTTDNYYCLGLVAGAVKIEESEERNIVAQTVTGLENLVVRMQGEYAYNVGMKGFTWDITNGGLNPDGTAIGTGTNWDKVASDTKDTAGVVVKTL